MDTAYSSKPIEDGAFVTPSRMNAKDYAGGGKVYCKEVSLNEVAWIDVIEGQYAKVSEQSQFKAKQQRAISTEEQRIEREAKSNGTWMKASDGMPSMLSPRQWVQVRTEAF